MEDKKNKNWVIKYISKVFSWFLLALLLFIAAFLIYYVVAANIYARKGEQFKPKFALYTIVSQSMVPNINVYDVIFDVRVDDIKKLKEGDVITFISSGYLNEGMTVTHRIVDIVETEEGLKFKTKGDNNLVPDAALVEPGNIIGKTLFKIPQLGRVQSLLATTGGWLLLVLLPALIIVIYDIVKIFKLTTVKKKVEQSISDNVVKVDPEQIKREEERKEKLKDKLLNDEEKHEEKPKPKTTPSNKNKKTKKSPSKPKTTSKEPSSKNPKTKKVVKVDIDLPKKK